MGDGGVVGGCDWGGDGFVGVRMRLGLGGGGVVYESFFAWI